jgi:hypothetical protein
VDPLRKQPRTNRTTGCRQRSNSETASVSLVPNEARHGVEHSRNTRTPARLKIRVPRQVALGDVVGWPRLASEADRPPAALGCWGYGEAAVARASEVVLGTSPRNETTVGDDALRLANQKGHKGTDETHY